MRVLVGHNYYQLSGGEDLVFHSETRMLKSFGHDVGLYERHNNEIKPDILSRSRHLASLRFSKRSFNEIQQLVRTFRPDVAHFHNTFFVMTPSVFYACQQEGVPVVLSLHNFRLMCLNGLFFRDNHPCEDCLQGSRMSGIFHRCYRGSWVFSAALDDMITHHFQRKTWGEQVNRIIVATEFSRKKHIQAGILPEMITVLPHFVEEPPDGLRTELRGNYALYAGRLSEEKGVEVLLRAWAQVRDLPLYIAGGGPQQGKLEKIIKEEGLSHVKMLGFLDRQEYLKVLSQAKFLAAPCLSYDNFPMVVVEAYSYGVPVLASRLGTLEEAVEDQVTGLLCTAGDADDISRKAREMVSDDGRWRKFCSNARQAYETKYSVRQHYQGLLRIYEGV